MLGGWFARLVLSHRHSPGFAGPSPRCGPTQFGPHEVVLEGVRFWYRVAGDAPAAAPPVVFLHGGPGAGSYEFAYFAGPELERGLRMIYFDQRGSGRSERPWSGDYAMSTLVDVIERLHVHLGAPRIALVAHSFGAALARQYAARRPERVPKMVIAGGLPNAAAGCLSGAERLRLLRAGGLRRCCPGGGSLRTRLPRAARAAARGHDPVQHVAQP